MPLPLAMMIPFMGTQSAVMMKQAGENWQYGKRLQSAMTNEEFNAQTTLSIFQKNSAEIRSMIPTMKQSIQDMRGFQDFIIVEMIELMRRGLETGLGAIFGLSPQQSNEFFGGTTGPDLVSSEPPPPTADEGVTVGGVTLPPVEVSPTPTPTAEPVDVPEPTPTPEVISFTTAEKLDFSFGMMREATSYGVRYYTGWTRKDHNKPVSTDGYNWNRTFSKNIDPAKITSALNSVFSPKSYIIMRLSYFGETRPFWVLRKSLGLPEKT